MTTSPPHARRLRDTRRRVLLLTQDLAVWGAQRQLVELALGLSPARYDVRIGTLREGGALAAELIDRGIPVESFPRRWRWDLTPITRLRAYLRRESIDVVHSFLFLPNFYARIAGRLARTPAVISSLRSTGIEGWPRYALDVATCFLCDALIANSNAGRDHYVRRGGLRRRVSVVWNGLSSRRSVAAPAQPELREAWHLDRFRAVVGMVAALEWRKDQHTLIRAMKDVLRHHTGTGLVLAGDGLERQKLERLARALGIASSVVFLGTLPEPERLYPLLDVYVQASFHGEGVSNSILEAMSHELPVVATEVGGNREVVVEGVTGHVTPRRDPAALAAAIGALLSDRTGRKIMGRAGAHRARTVFSLERMISRTERVYDSILGPVVSPAAEPQPAGVRLAAGRS